MGWADKVANSEPGKGGVYPEPGVYPVLWIERCALKESRKGDDLYIVEFKILKSEVSSRPAGSEMSQVYNLSKHEAAAGNVKAFIAAAIGIDEKDVDADGVEATVTIDQPLRGRLVRAEASVTKTRAGGDFTVVRFSSLADKVQADAKKLHEAAGFAPF